MTAFPTRTTELRRHRSSAVAAFYLIVSIGCVTECVAASPATRIDAIRDLGVQVKLAVDRVEAGQGSDLTQVTRFDSLLAQLPPAAADGSADRSEAKRKAVEHLLSKLKILIAQGVGTTAAPMRAASSNASSRLRVDLQTVNFRHGADCATALGIGASLPVRIVLADATHGGGAWFRFSAVAGGHYRFSTDSTGPDPNIEIRRACNSDEVAAANDDDLGLDAAAIAQVGTEGTLLVHVANSGAAGTITLSVADVNGSVNGKISDAVTQQPIGGASVYGYSTYGAYEFSTLTDASGNYTLQMSAGDYYVRAFDDSHLAVLYASAVCTYPTYSYSLNSCDVNQAQLVSVTSGTALPGINLALPPGRRIEGSVRDISNQPVTATVELHDAAGNLLNGVSTDTYGRFVITPLPSTSYTVLATASGFGKQMFDHADCGGPNMDQCNFANATDVDVSSGDVTAVNFNMQPLATIEGNAFAPGDQPLQGYSVIVLDAFGNQVAQYYYVTQNPYKVGPLGIGTYYVYAMASGYFWQIYDSIDCGNNCATKIPSAIAITIDHAGQAAHADFHLNPVPVVHGHVQDAQSALPLANVGIAISTNPPSSFYAVQNTATDPLGNFTLNGVSPGSYYLWAQSNDHVDQIYPNVVCEQLNYYYGANCDVSGATLLTIAPGQVVSSFDFSLFKSSGIHGSATVNAGPDSDLPAYVSVTAFNGAGGTIASTSTDAAGNYALDDLPPGTYFMAATSGGAAQYISQLWQHIDCPDTCPPTTGTPLPLAQSVIQDDIDFRLVRQNAVVGRVTDASNQPIGGVLIDLFNATTGAYAGTGATDAQGYYGAGPNNPGNAYFVATDSGGAYIDQVNAGIKCPNGSAYFGLCSLTGATGVALTYFNTQPVVVNFRLDVTGTIFANGFDP